MCLASGNMGKTGAERLRESLERKKQKKRESNARFYAKNKDQILEKRKEERRRQRYPTEPLHKISALQVELELAGKFRNEIQNEILLGRFSLEKICWDFIKYRLYLGKMNQNPFAG